MRLGGRENLNINRNMYIHTLQYCLKQVISSFIITRKLKRITAADRFFSAPNDAIYYIFKAQ